MMRCKIIFFTLAIFILNACSSKKEIKTVPTPPQEAQKTPGEKIKPRQEVTRDEVKEKKVYQTGIASWYGEKFHGRRTANGEVYNMYKLTAAHKTLPFNTLLKVKNLNNGKEVLVRINDRGPFIKGRIIDLSYKAACGIGLDIEGTAPVALKITKPPIQGSPPKTVKAEVEQPVWEESAREVTTQGSLTFYVQAGAFSEKQNADRMLRNIRLIFSDIPFNIHFQNGLYKVISDPLTAREKAEEVKRILTEIDIDAFIREEWQP
jgi:rare lipoprotein A (peptidoglycan hydrolase)